MGGVNGRTKGLIGVSLAAAGALGLLVYLGGPGATGGNGDGVRIVQPGEEATGLGDPNAIRVEAADFFVTTDDRETRFVADRIDPIDGQPFRFEVEQPVARTYFKDTQQFLEVRAARGNLYAPGNDPQSGRFIGNVAVTLYAPAPNPDGSVSPPDWDAPDDAVMHVLLQEAEFDLQLGTLASRSPMDLYTRDAEFHGVGLQLTFNERRNQLAFLRIDRGDFLRIHRPETLDDNKPATPRRTPSDPTRLADDEPDASPPQRPRVASNESPPQDVDKPAQFYEATFEDNIRIASLDNAFSGRGDTMQLLFGIDPDDADDGLYNGLGLRPTAPSPRTRVAAHLSSARTTTTTQSAGMPAITPTGPRDVEIRWDGPLVVVPRPNQPNELLNASDYSLQLTGRPASLLTADGDTVDGQLIAYDKLRQRVRVVGDPPPPRRRGGPAPTPGGGSAPPDPSGVFLKQ